MFLRNERGLGVKNGTLGTVERISAQSMAVRTDDGRSVAFDPKHYAHIDHGYAATIHKAQGMTVDRTHVLATPGMDSHGAYVAMSRHRDGLTLHYGRDDFAGQSKLVRTLSRERGKDMASDYKPEQQFAERRIQPGRHARMAGGHMAEQGRLRADLQPGRKNALVEALERPVHHPMLTERDRAAVAVQGQVTD